MSQQEAIQKLKENISQLTREIEALENCKYKIEFTKISIIILKKICFCQSYGNKYGRR